jgi:hypothetical protein
MITGITPGGGRYAGDTGEVDVGAYAAVGATETRRISMMRQQESGRDVRISNPETVYVEYTMLQLTFDSCADSDPHW